MPFQSKSADDVAIVTASRGDIGVIAKLTRSAYSKWVPLIGREPLPMRVDYALAFDSHRFDLLLDGGRVVGLVETVHQERYLLIVNVAVEPACQGRGFGRKLIAHAESLALASKLDGVRLYTNSRFVENIRLYASLAYEVEREESLNGGVAVHMKKAF